MLPQLSQTRNNWEKNKQIPIPLPRAANKMMGVYNGSKCDLEYDTLCKEFCIKGGDKLIDAFQG